MTLLRTLAVLAGVAAVAGPAAAAPAQQTAVFAGGCFWTMEHKFERLPGVTKVVSGYTGGREKNPRYEQVASETTGHVEAVQVTYDPARVTYRQLVDRYWRMIDPRDDGGQACDRGPSYRAMVFVRNADEKAAAMASKAAIDTGVFKGRIVTPIRDAATFWPAEREHQDFAARNRAQYERYRVGCGRDRILAQIWPK